MPEWEEVEVEPTDRARVLPDGRVMQESRITVSPEMMEQIWQGYRCAACLEDVAYLGAFPTYCPLCNFPIAELQRKRLEEDFVGEVEGMKRDGWIDGERARLEEQFFEPKPQIHVRRKP